MANPEIPVVADFPIPPPIPQFQFVDENGILTHIGVEFLQRLWAAIQGKGGIADLIFYEILGSLNAQAIAEGLLNKNLTIDANVPDAMVAALQADLEQVKALMATLPAGIIAGLSRDIEDAKLLAFTASGGGPAAADDCCCSCPIVISATGDYEITDTNDCGTVFTN